MADSLKTFFSPALVRRLAAEVARAHFSFNVRAFTREACAGLDDLELLDRGKHISRALAAHLPESYPAAVKILLRSLGPEHASEELVGVGMAPFFYLPHTLFVAEHGLDHFDVSMKAQYELTKRFSAESSIRPYIARYPERTFAVLREWTRDPNPHVRRLVSEGTRLRLPWAGRVPWLDANPERVLTLLELLKDDPATLVRRSVANNLNDLGKLRPELLTRTCAAWLEDASPARRALVEHALRSAVKRGHAESLQLLGYGKKASVAIDHVQFDPPRVAIGRRVSIGFTLRSRSRTPQDLLVDLAVHFVKANGQTAPKVFKLKRVVLPPRGEVELRTGISLKVHTTRKPRPGTTCGGHHHQRRCHTRRRIRGDTVNLRIAFFVACLTATTAGWQQAPRAKPEAIGLSSAQLREASDLFNRFVAEQRIAGAVAAVARHGQIGYLETFGVQDLQTKVPMSERSLFRIYSMTRPITAVAVMMLHEEKQFVLDDPVAKFIPEFGNVVVAGTPGAPPRETERPITVRDLLLHTSGLNARTSEIYRREQVRSRTMTMAQFIANLVRVPLMEDPGTRYRYSEGTTVLGRLVEIWSGKPFEAFLNERIFRPLRMTDTMFWAATPDQRARLTTVYGPAPGGGLSPVETETLPFTERPTLIEGAVGLLSTVPDYVRFSQMLLNKGQLDGVRLLPSSTVEMMTRNGLSAAVQQTKGGSTGWGLANVQVVLDSAGQDAAVGEYGWDGTAGTIFWIDPGKNLLAVLMTQSSPANPDQIRQQFKAIVQLAAN